MKIRLSRLLFRGWKDFARRVRSRGSVHRFSAPPSNFSHIFQRLHERYGSSQMCGIRKRHHVFDRKPFKQALHYRLR